MEHKVIGGKRVCGKSTELIRQSHGTGIRILTANRHMARFLMEESKEMGLDIKPPLTPGVEFNSFSDVKEVLVDDAELVLQELIGKRIAGMSTSYQLEELPALKQEKEEVKPLLTIELDQIGNVPKVFYKGEEVTSKKRIGFYWETRTDKPGHTEFTLNYYKENEQSTPTEVEITEARRM